jgi:hypothetical protein
VRWLDQLDGPSQAILGLALLAVAAGSLIGWPSSITFLILVVCGIPGLILLLGALITP